MDWKSIKNTLRLNEKKKPDDVIKLLCFYYPSTLCVSRIKTLKTQLPTVRIGFLINMQTITVVAYFKRMWLDIKDL